MDDGVRFPLVEGRRSSQRTGRDVLAAAAGAVDPALAGAVAAEPHWRRRYPGYLRRLTEATAPSPAAEVTVAREGLAGLHETLLFVRDGSEGPLSEAAATRPAARFAARTVAGRGRRIGELVVPYRGQDLRGDALLAQLASWVGRGVVEPSFAEAVRAVVEHPGWLDLSGTSFALLGAAAEMAPTEALLRWGADVLAVDVPVPAVWQRLAALAESGAGRLRAPIRPGGSVPGADLAAELPELRAWLEHGDAPVVLGSYAYADGAAFLRVAAAADVLYAALRTSRPGTGLAYLATPTDVFAVPGEAMAAALAAQQRSTPLVRFARAARRATGGRLFVPSYRHPVAGPDGDPVGVMDALILQQGPNYALAKRLQRWRAVVARADGAVSSAHVAPPTGTRSLTRNRLLAAAYAGAPALGVEVFEPATTRALMAAVLVCDLRSRHVPANPASSLAAGEDLLRHAAAHGGLWRLPWEPRSALPLAVALGAPSLLKRGHGPGRR